MLNFNVVKGKTCLEDFIFDNLIDDLPRKIISVEALKKILKEIFSNIPCYFTYKDKDIHIKSFRPMYNSFEPSSFKLFFNKYRVIPTTPKEKGFWDIGLTIKKGDEFYLYVYHDNTSTKVEFASIYLFDSDIKEYKKYGKVKTSPVAAIEQDSTKEIAKDIKLIEQQTTYTYSEALKPYNEIILAFANKSEEYKKYGNGITKSLIRDWLKKSYKIISSNEKAEFIADLVMEHYKIPKGNRKK